MTNQQRWTWDRKNPSGWQLDSEEVLSRDYYFGAILSRKAHRGSQSINFNIIDAKDFVQCIAVTKDNNLILVSQFRPGNKGLTLEVPGCAIEPGEQPIVAAERELREESGYTGDKPVLLWSGFGNPALGTAHAFYYLIRNCLKSHDTCFDPTEDLATYLLPINQLDNVLDDDTFCHAITVTGLLLFQRWLHRNPES